jgi:release factor glutamine methyltransferase
VQEVRCFVDLVDRRISNIPLRNAAYRLLADSIGIDRRYLHLHIHDFILSDVSNQFEKNLEELLQGKPLHRILGYRWFWNDKFELSADTLEPRPDTESLIEACLKYLSDRQHPHTFLDVGTGSGCILLSLLGEYPNSRGLGIDISENAIATAQTNAVNLNLDNRTAWTVSNWFDNVNTKFDVIVSNPPYIPSSDIIKLSEAVRLYDPLKALDGGEDGLEAYKYFAEQMHLVMEDGALAFLEIGYDQGETVPELFAKKGYMVIDIVKDYGSNPRCVVLRKP